MKKQLLGKIFTALIILVVSACFINLKGQVKVIFENSDDRDNRTEGIADRQAVHLDYTIDGSGNIALDVWSPSIKEDVVALLDSWDDPNAGTTDIASLFGKSFSFLLKTNGPRLDCREKGGLGIQGKNSGRIDNVGKEILYIILEGSVGVTFDSLAYEPTERGGGDNAHFRLIDYDTDDLYYLADGDSIVNFADGEMQMRFASDTLTVTTDDVVDGGGRLLGLYFTLIEPTNPSIAGISPTPGDTLVDVTSDFVVLFNMPMNTATTEAAVTITPALANRVNTWNGAGDELTISSDDLEFLTDYEMVISTDAISADGVNSIVSFNYAYQSLPDAPTVVGTYPVDEAEDVPAGSPMILEFTRAMITDSVENAISISPAVDTMMFSWNGSNTKLIVSTDLEPSTEYTITLSTDASDTYGVFFAEPVSFSFMTAIPVAVDNAKYKDLALYPNPVSDVLYIKGMDVSSVSIHSITGQLMKSTYNSREIDLSDIESGSYVVTIADRNNNSVRKLIVKQ